MEQILACIRTDSGTYVATEGGSSATCLRAQAAALGELSRSM
ncbi:hypothetical protein ACWGH3_06045 [Streptomyces sp. NPDC054884]|nr:hypothetical protein [Streptomyces sp. ME08-AFT2]MDX3308453.1 hypothetical protein [Streptomyces sp. ME08-AFT2]